MFKSTNNNYIMKLKLSNTFINKKLIIFIKDSTTLIWSEYF